MATNIPPHSLNELIDGLLYLLDSKDVSLEEIMQFIKGPDFPTGGIIYGKRYYRSLSHRAWSRESAR